MDIKDGKGHLSKIEREALNSGSPMPLEALKILISARLIALRNVQMDLFEQRATDDDELTQAERGMIISGLDRAARYRQIVENMDQQLFAAELNNDVA